MSRALDVAALAAADCAVRPLAMPLRDVLRDLPVCARRAVTTGGVRFGFASRDERTLALLDAVWAGHVAQDGEVADSIVCAPVDGLRGRYVDVDAGLQLLAFDYAPFTLVKQALRWQYGRQSAASGLMPVHGVVLEAGGRTVCISARGQSGKSFLADTWLACDDSARVLVDDWSLLDSRDRTIRRVGDASLHIRGAGLQRGSRQLEGAQPALVELCEDDPAHNETRYLVPRHTLPAFAYETASRRLDTLVLIRDPFSQDFCVRDDNASVSAAFEAEALTFWDDSLALLPGDVVAYLREAWSQVLRDVQVVVMQGHRQREPREVIAALRTAVAG